MGAIEEARANELREGVGSRRDIRDKADTLRSIEEKQRLKLEEHDASIIKGITGAFRHETGTGVAFEMIKDAVMYPQDEDFDVKEVMDSDTYEFPTNVVWEQDLLRSAKSQAHYDVLSDRIKSKREYMLNAQDLGILPTMGLQLVAEFGNIPNYFTFGLAGLAKANKLKRFLVSGAITGTANSAEEAFIGQMYNDRTATDYIVAGAAGMGLGWLGTLGHSAKLAKHIDDVGDNFGKTHMKNQVSEKFEEFKGESFMDTSKNLISNMLKKRKELKALKDTDADPSKLHKELKDVEDEVKNLHTFDGKSTVGAQQIESIYKAFDSEFDPKMTTPKMDEDNPFVQSAFADYLIGGIPKADKLPHEKVGLTSMSQTLHSSENPLTRYMAKLLFEYPEGVGRWNDHTAALMADLDFQKFAAEYTPEYQRLNAAWNVLAEQRGDIKHTFDEAASMWIDDSATAIHGSSKQMDAILEEFRTLYTNMNKQTHKIMKESGVLEADGVLDSNYIARGWDGERFQDARNKYGDDVVVETLQESILESDAFKPAYDKATKEWQNEIKLQQEAYEHKVQKAQEELDEIIELKRKAESENLLSKESTRLLEKKAKAYEKLKKVKADKPDVEFKQPDMSLDAKRMAQALYNRFINRATNNTADANLLSSANRTLLNDALDDIPMKSADRKHIDRVLETMGRDQRANPLKHQMGMDIGYVHHSGLKVRDFMNNDLGSAYASKTRMWLGRAAAAKQGINSEDAFQKAIEQIRRHGSDRGQDIKEIKADIARLEAGWKMLKAQPVEDMSAFGNMTMRVVRKLMASSALGKLGVVQAGETGRVAAAVGIQNAFKTIPVMKDILAGMVNGKLDTPTLRDFEDHIFGKIGDDHYMNSPQFRADDFGHKISKAEKQIDRMSFWLSKASGWHAIHTAQKKYLMNGLAQKWRREFIDGTMTSAQLKDLGVPPHHIDGIKADLVKHSKKIDDTGSYNLNIGKWKPEHRRTFALMLHRKSANAVQDIIVGETPLWTNRGIGKFLAQFRTFSIAALGKQTVHDYRMYKQGDAEAALAMQFMLCTSTMAVMARMAFDAAVLPEGERKKYMKNNAHPRAIAKRVLNYHGQFAPLIDMTELIASTVMPNSWGQLTGNSMYRNGRGLTGKIPGVSYIDRAYKGASGLVKGVMPNEKMSKSDWNAFVGAMPLSSWYGFHALNKRVVKPMIFD